MKKTLLIILALALVLTLGAPVALADPTESPDEGDTEEPADTTTAFPLLMLESKGMAVFRVQMRLRDLGYFNYRPTGLYYGMTQTAVMDFQVNNSLDSDGRVGEQTYAKLFSVDAVRKPLDAATMSQIKIGVPNFVGTPPAPGEPADWSTVVDEAFPVGATATVTDYYAGLSFTVRRTGGEGHADVETVDQEAYDTFLKCFGGETNWEKRSVLVTVGDATYAASLFGNPSGVDTIANNGMDGHTDLYFSGSTSDVLGFVDKEHDAKVMRAAGQL